MTDGSRHNARIKEWQLSEMTDQKQKRIKPDELKLGQQHKATEEQAIVPSHPAGHGRPHNQTRIEIRNGNPKSPKETSSY